MFGLVALVGCGQPIGPVGPAKTTPAPRDTAPPPDSGNPPKMGDVTAVLAGQDVPPTAMPNPTRRTARQFPVRF